MVGHEGVPVELGGKEGGLVDSPILLGSWVHLLSQGRYLAGRQLVAQSLQALRQLMHRHPLRLPAGMPLVSKAVHTVHIRYKA